MEVPEATLHKLVSYSQPAPITCSFIDWTVQPETWPPLGLIGSFEMGEILSSNEGAIDQSLHLIKRDSLQTSLEVKNSLAD